MRTEEEIRKQIELCYQELRRIEKEETRIPTQGHWRYWKRYIDGLEYALGEE